MLILSYQLFSEYLTLLMHIEWDSAFLSPALLFFSYTVPSLPWPQNPHIERAHT